MKIFIALIYVALLTATLSGCGGNRDVKASQVSTEIEKNAPPQRLNDLLLMSAATHSVDPNADYVIGADDLLEIDVFQAEEIRRTVRVSPQGYIGMPLIGEIKAKGLTPVQLEKEISGKLEKYLQEPRVNVSVKEYKAQKIAVIGAVAKSDIYTVTGQRYLLDMLIMAGGLSSNAEICYILRPSGSEQHGAVETKILTINLIQLIEKGDFSLNIPVFNGDVINVPKSGIVFIDGEVNRPGPFPVTSKMTLREAIIMAGGLKYEADATDVKILRDQGDGKREVIPLNYNDIKEGKTNDVSVKEKDIVIVGTNGLKYFVSQFFRFITGSVNTVGGASVGVTK